jgi:hypothetical protein
MGFRATSHAFLGDIMDLDRDVHSTTASSRAATAFLRQLKQSGRPLVLSVDGKAEVVVQDEQSYQCLLDLAERLETVEAVKEGLASIDRGEGTPMDEFFDDLEQMLLSQDGS